MTKSGMVFVNVGWMIHYTGVSASDPTLGGHGYLKKNKSGYEAWNFLPHRNKMYGYVPRSSRIMLRNLGGTAKSSQIDGVIVVWVARNPRNKKPYIVGWYKNATVYKDSDHVTVRRRGGPDIGYQIVAPAEQAVLLPIDQRLFLIPTARTNGKGNLGQSPLWYGRDDKFRSSVLEYIEAGGILAATSSSGKKKGNRQADPELRKQIELAAVRHATEYYESKCGGSQTVMSVEKDGVGWDLNVVAPTGEVLKVEVKGLSGKEVVVELTPNEYAKMQDPVHRADYIIYIVTEAGTASARSHVFEHNAELSKSKTLVWNTSDGRQLEIVERIAARLSAPYQAPA